MYDNNSLHSRAHYQFMKVSGLFPDSHIMGLESGNETTHSAWFGLFF